MKVSLKFLIASLGGYFLVFWRGGVGFGDMVREFRPYYSVASGFLITAYLWKRRSQRESSWLEWILLYAFCGIVTAALFYVQIFYQSGITPTLTGILFEIVASPILVGDWLWLLPLAYGYQSLVRMEERIWKA